MITSPRISTSSPGSGGSPIIVKSKVSLAQAKEALQIKLLDSRNERLFISGNSVTISIIQEKAIADLPVPCLKDVIVERINNFSWEIIEGSYNIYANLIAVNTKIRKAELMKINSNTPSYINLNFLQNELKAGNLYRAKLIWDLTGTYYLKNPVKIITKANAAEVINIKNPKFVEQLTENTAKDKTAKKTKSIKKLENRNPEIKKVTVEQVPTNLVVETYNSEDFFYFFIREITDSEIIIHYINSLPLAPVPLVSDIHIHHNLT